MKTHGVTTFNALGFKAAEAASVAKAASATKATGTTPSSVGLSPKKKAELHQAAKAFETILVKQLLSTAHVLGAEKGGYSDMALDALSKGMSDGGGIGLAKSIEDSVLASERAPKK